MKKISSHKLRYRLFNSAFFLILTMFLFFNGSSTSYAMTDEPEKEVQITIKEKDIKKENSKYKKEK